MRDFASDIFFPPDGCINCPFSSYCLDWCWVEFHAKFVHLSLMEKSYFTNVEIRNLCSCSPICMLLHLLFGLFIIFFDIQVHFWQMSIHSSRLASISFCGNLVLIFLLKSNSVGTIPVEQCDVAL